MKQVLVDTNCWLALFSKKDNLHKRAIEVNKELLEKEYRYITTNFILDETYTLLISKVGHYAAVDFGERVRVSQTIRVIHISEEIEEKAWKLFKQYSDKKFSFTDCTSFVVMRDLNLEEAFTDDRHFKQIGFKTLLK